MPHLLELSPEQTPHDEVSRLGLTGFNANQIPPRAPRRERIYKDRFIQHFLNAF